MFHASSLDFFLLLHSHLKDIYIGNTLERYTLNTWNIPSISLSHSRFFLRIEKSQRPKTGQQQVPCASFSPSLSVSLCIFFWNVLIESIKSTILPYQRGGGDSRYTRLNELTGRLSICWQCSFFYITSNGWERQPLNNPRSEREIIKIIQNNIENAFN